MNPKDLVRSGYDKMADSYLASKDPSDPLVISWLEKLGANLPDGVRVLDLGCGAGIPTSKWLANRFSVLGIDISERQIALARQQVPNASFIQSDMIGLDFAVGLFRAVTAFYSIIHLPREEQPGLLENINRWLAPGGLFLANWATGAWEGSETNWEGWGGDMWWSHYDASTNRAMIEQAGFDIVEAEQQTNNGETWLWVLARKSGQ